MNARANGQSRHLARRTITVVVIVALLLGGLAVAGGYLWSQFGSQISLMFGWTTNDYEGEGHGEARVVVTEGEIGEDIAASLAEGGIVKTSEAFYELLLEQDPAVEFMPGTYMLKQEMSSQAALDALQDPENRLAYTAIIPEGKTVDQTLELVSAGADIPLEELQEAAKDPAAYGIPEGSDSLEGWLFPATYEFEEDTTGAEAISQMIEAQVLALDEQGVAVEDRQRVLNIAAMVQREGGRIEDFGKISRVIDNRLQQGMKLQMDSTAQYGIGQHAEGTVWSTDEALADDNPWNTYVHEGLPKGPIANPGRDAIAAAVNPEPGNWMYFVAVNLETGESAFSVTQEEHEAAVARLTQWCSENPGQGC